MFKNQRMFRFNTGFNIIGMNGFKNLHYLIQ